MTENFKVPYTTILNISPHPGADRLEFATVYGFQVVVQKDRYKQGDNVVYVPIDSILPEDLENRLFPSDSKIKLTKGRIRQIKIRSMVSQGMLIDPVDLKHIFHHGLDESLLEVDLSESLGITKYEPPSRDSEPRAKTPRNKPKENPRFHKYNGVTNIKWAPTVFDGLDVVIQEKLHGSNCRAAYLPAQANTLWKKFLKLLNMLPEFEYCHGSNNVQLQERPGNTGYYGRDIYLDVLKKVGALEKLRPGETIYGELIGEGVQKNYTYGVTGHHFVLFDVKVENDGMQNYLDPEQVEAFAKERGFDFVPVLYRGPYVTDVAKRLSQGPSVYNPEQKVREGVVIKARFNYGFLGDKQAFKLINEDYLNDKENTDFN